MKLLGTRPEGGLPGRKKGFRISLGNLAPEQMALLLSRAFDREVKTWYPSEGALAVPIVKTSGGRIVGACTLVRPCFLHQFAVDPEFQLQGLGRWLYEWTAWTFELPYVLVSVDEDTSEAGHKFWKALGFTEIGS